MTETPSTEPEVGPGDVIAGKYRVEAEIGSGGMGVVVSARHVTMGNRLAIKILRVKEDKDPRGAVTRFVREARAAARIQSDHVVRVTDVAALPDGTPYMVMEYLEGEDLRALLERRGELSIEEAVGYALQACEGLAEAHASGVIHRDLKPSNLFLSKKSNGTTVLKLLDFGISKVLPRAGEAGITTTGALMGSPLYMAPEQMKSSKDVDTRADVWSLGLILYELLSGRPPFEGESIPEVCLSVMGSDPLPMSRFRADVPPALEAVLLKCLTKQREGRYETMGALARALEPFAAASSRVHAERASVAIKTARSERPAGMDEDEAPLSSLRSAAGSKPQLGGILVRRAPESVPSWSAGRARPRTRTKWIAIGAAACVGAIAIAILVARAPSARPTQVTTGSATVPSAAPPSPPLVATSDLPSVPFESLPVAAHEAGLPRAAAVPARKPVPPPPPASGTASAQKDGWKWGDRN